MSNAVQLFTAADGQVQLSVSMDKETVWLSLDQLVQLFERDKSVVSRHLRNLFAEGELVRTSVVAKNATTAADGKTYQVDYYNLDVIISVGYFVIKNHPLADGNKRCGSFLFLWYLRLNPEPASAGPARRGSGERQHLGGTGAAGGGELAGTKGTDGAFD